MANADEQLKYRIPFIKDTFKVSSETLDYHADRRFPKNERLKIDVWVVAFTNDLLTMAIKIDDEPERRVFLKILDTELLVGCSENTTKNHISRSAYYVLRRMSNIDHFIDFENYYWNGFFDSEGQSKYLDILNFRGRLDIYLKEEYIYFFKPGQHLEYPRYERKFRRPVAYWVNREVLDFQTKSGVGFCLFFCHHNHFPHLPILVPFQGTVAKTKASIKSFNKFFTSEIDFDEYNFSEVQKSIYEICREMILSSTIIPITYKCERATEIVLENKNKRGNSRMLGLWHNVLASLVLQPYTHSAVGLWNIKHKLRKGYVSPITFGLETPKICFLWIDKGEYFELDYRFRINEEVLTPAKFINPYFVSSTENPDRYYLFQSITDCETTSFFRNRELKIYVLKVHFERYFKLFLEELGEFYEIILS